MVLPNLSWLFLVKNNKVNTRKQSVLTWCQLFDPWLFQIRWRLSLWASWHLWGSLENTPRDTWGVHSSRDLWGETRFREIRIKTRQKLFKKGNIHTTHYQNIPTLYPERNLPSKIISKDWAMRLKSMMRAATIATTLLNKRAFFLQNQKKQQIYFFALLMSNSDICFVLK